MVDTDGEGGEVVITIVGTHLRQVELLADLTAHRHANQAFSLRGHEVDVFGGGKLGSANEVALVLAIRVVEHQYTFARLDGGNGLFDCIKLVIHILIRKTPSRPPRGEEIILCCEYLHVRRLGRKGLF